MENKPLKVEYLYHSGYTIEAGNYFFIFDYFRGNINIPTDKQVIVFSSHGHPDHFNEEIFRWSRENGSIIYILSDDIDVHSTETIKRMGPYEKLNINDLTIETLGSTDMGVSFLVKLEGSVIFFAGDLHWWYWDDDSKGEKRRMETAFKDEIERLKGQIIDLAFFPIDPRLGEFFHLGGEYFINEIHPKKLFPLHFGDNYKVIGDFINKMGNIDTQIIDVTHRNQVFEL